MGGRMFDSLAAVISRYRNEQIVAGYRLGEPLLRGTTGSGSAVSLSTNSSTLNSSSYGDNILNDQCVAALLAARCGMSTADDQQQQHQQQHQQQQKQQVMNSSNNGT